MLKLTRHRKPCALAALARPHSHRVREVSWTAVDKRSGDTAFERTERIVHFHPYRVGEISVALRFPLQFMTR